MVDIDALDPRPWRALADRSFEALDGLRLPFSERLDAAVRQIPHPPVEPVAQRGRLGKKSEAHTLYAATDQEPSSNPHGNSQILRFSNP